MLNGQFHVYICLCFGLVLVIPESFLNKQIEKNYWRMKKSIFILLEFDMNILL